MARLLTALTLAAATGLAFPNPALANNRDWDRASGIGRDLLVVAAFGVPAVQGDWHGDIEAAESTAVTTGVTFALKELVHERRPDRSDDHSFPSGHTSVSFAAAVGLEQRYGWKAGLPALAVASFVGVARVEADKHYVHDVLAGAAIGTASALLFTHKHDERVSLVPWATHGGGGIDVAMRF